MNKAIIESYLRNLVGALLGAITIVMGSTGIASPLDFGGTEWLLVANALWASAVPTLLRWVNKKDPAFGMVAEAVAKSVSTKIDQEVKKSSTKTSAGTGKVSSADTKKPATKKATPKTK